MLGLIAALTPVLYKHVADRRQDIDNINEANVMLVLKNRAAEYIEANKDTLSVGTTVLTPTDIGVEIGGYTIGIRKRSDGSVSAMIASTSGGNDMKAAKVASLLGVSAGIYSAQDANRAWGINGVWAENISNYGFTSLPTGVPVVTTDYEKENTAVLDMEEIFAAIEEHEFAVLKAKELCLNGDCITNWDRESPVETIQKCNMGISASCKRGYENTYNRTCQNIYDTYQENHDTFSNGFYTLTNSETSFTPQQYCMCEDDICYSAEEIIEKCNTAKDIANKFCQMGYENELNTSCANIVTYASRRSGEVNTLTRETETVDACCAGSEEFRFGDVHTYLATTTSAIGSGENKTPVFKEISNICAGKYKIRLLGEGGYGVFRGGFCDGSGAYTNGCSGAGGILLVSEKKLEKGTSLTFRSIAGYSWSHWNEQATSGAGTGMWEIGEIKLVAGGGGFAASGGGGYVGGYGIQNDLERYDGYGYNGVKGSSQSYCSSASCTGTAWGGRSEYYADRYVRGFGGSAYCAAGYTCTHIPGGNARTWGTSGYSASSYGNSAIGSAEITFLSE